MPGGWQPRKPPRLGPGAPHAGSPPSKLHKAPARFTPDARVAQLRELLDDYRPSSSQQSKRVTMARICRVTQVGRTCLVAQLCAGVRQNAVSLILTSWVQGCSVQGENERAPRPPMRLPHALPPVDEDVAEGSVAEGSAPPGRKHRAFRRRRKAAASRPENIRQAPNNVVCMRCCS